MVKKKIDILYPYPTDKAPSQRFRIEQYLPILSENFEVKIYSFWSTKTWEILYKKGHAFQKIFGLIGGFARRKLYLLKAAKADYIYIHREATPIGPPFIEWVLAKVLKKKIIYDFDDAIWLANQSEVNRGLVKNLKYHKKVGKICSWAYKVCVGNEYLADYARQFKDNVVIIPTTVDTEAYHNPILYSEKPFDKSASLRHAQGDRFNNIPIIGWTGTHSTLQHLDILWPVLDELIKEIPFIFHIISDVFPTKSRSYIRPIYWSKDSEMYDLNRFDIGVMPLIENEWAKGKCGFKLIQYMALEIPSIASEVGVNAEIIDSLDLGFLIPNNDSHAWKKALLDLLENPDLRTKIGTAGRKRIMEKYSLEANKDKVLGLFNG